MHLCWLQCQENTFPAEGWQVGRWGGSRARGGWVLRLGSSGQGGRQSSTVLLMQLSCLEGLVQVPACLRFQHILLNTIACVCLIIRRMPIVHWNSKVFRNAKMWVQNKKGGTKVWHCCGECWKIPWAQGKTGQAVELKALCGSAHRKNFWGWKRHGRREGSLSFALFLCSFFFLSLCCWSPVKTENWVNRVCCLPRGLMFCSRVTSPKPGLDVLKRFNYLLLLCTHSAGGKKKHNQFQSHFAEGCTNSRALTVQLCFLLRCLLPLSAPI